MKKLLAFLIVGIFVLSGLGAVTGTEDDKEFKSEPIALSRPIIEEKENYVSIELTEATYSSWETNMPSLPVVTKVYTFPFGTRIDSVEVRFSDSMAQEISKPVIPSPEVKIDSIISSTENSDKPVALMTYSDIDVYPEQRFSYKTGAGLKGEEHVIYLSVHLYPVEYHPKENTIYSSDEAIIDITYIPPEKPVVFPDEYDLLVITPAEFSDAFYTPDPEFDISFMDFKNNNDISTNIVTLDEIYNGDYFPAEGVDDQEKIKYFIKNSIETWGITYVILVGSWVELEDEPPESQYAKFPIRKAYIKSSNYEDWFPSDLYYADIYDSEMEFSDWDFDGDGKYAEYKTDMPNIDVIPDVYLGKLCCINIDEVNTYINKVIRYKKHNKMTNKIVQAGGDSFTGDSINEGEYANTQVYETLPNDYTTTQLWASTETLTKKNIADGFNNNVDFVDFCGHGSWASFATHPPGDDETWVPPKSLISPYTGFLYLDFDLYLVSNAMKLPVCVYKSCSNNKYSEAPNCFGWKTVSKKGGGGIAVFAASGISYGSHGTDIVKRTTGWMEVKSFEELIDTKLLGQVWGNSITDYYNTFELELGDADWKTLLEWSMFGDPTLVIEDGDDPEDVSINKPAFANILERFLGNFPILAQIVYKVLKL